ncbi:hypothetical protein H6775_03765 [Candidatus Nomurabacteria bacterium]|nr:hypothetical protein [Candidatus Nomurabacteria bacterium]
MNSALIIQAGGKGSRLLGENAAFSKVYFCYKGKSILKYWQENFSAFEVSAIINKGFENIFPNENVFYSDEQNGDFSDLFSQVAKTTKDRVVIVWSDYIIKEEFLNDVFDLVVHNDKNVIGSTSDLNCRIKFKEKDNQEGFFGFMKVSAKNLKTPAFLLKALQHKCFEDFYNNENIFEFFDEIYSFPQGSLVDLGTRDEAKKLPVEYSGNSGSTITYLNSGFVQKSFPSVAVMENEQRWYKHFYPEIDDTPPRNPGYYNSDRYLILKELRPYFSLKEEERPTIDQIVASIDEYQRKNPMLRPDGKGLIVEDSFPKRIYNYIYDTPRISEGTKKGGRKHRKEKEIRLIADALCNEINEFEKDNLFPLSRHGDTTLSNLCLDENNKIIWIDPRPGTFCFSSIFDYAKLYYSLCGYDVVNTCRYSVLKEGDKLTIDFFDGQKMPSLYKKDLGGFKWQTLALFLPIFWLSFYDLSILTKNCQKAFFAKAMFDHFCEEIMKEKLV